MVAGQLRADSALRIKDLDMEHVRRAGSVRVAGHDLGVNGQSVVRRRRRRRYPAHLVRKKGIQLRPTGG